MATTQLPPDFREFLRLLNAKAVEYLVVGDYAVAFHGFPRPAGHLDVWVSIHHHNIGRVLEVLREFGFGGSELSPVLFEKPRAVVRMGVPPVRIEIQTHIPGVEFPKCYPRRIVGVLDGEPVSLIDLDDLRENKRAAGRHKDLADLDNLP